MEESKKLKAEGVNSGSDSDSNCDTTLDIKSEEFDPLAALYAPNLNVAAKRVALYDNLASFESAFSKLGADVGTKGSLKARQPQPSTSDTRRMQSSSTSNAGGSLPNRRFLPHQEPIKGSGGVKLRHKRNIFEQMEKHRGPLSGLQQFVEKGVRVKVYTRKEKGVRGFITGQIICFDKHWNMLLRDAYETWKKRKFKYSENKTICGPPMDCSERLKNLGIEVPTLKTKSLSRKYVECSRKVNQIMIRGEQVVLVTPDGATKEEPG